MSGDTDKLAQIAVETRRRIENDALHPLSVAEACDVLALVEIAKAAREVESWRPQTRIGMGALHPQDRDAINALRAALSALDGDT